MNREDYTVEDVLEMDARKRDRIIGYWMGQIYDPSCITGQPSLSIRDYHSDDDSICWPRYSQLWKFCGRVLEHLPRKVVSAYMGADSLSARFDQDFLHDLMHNPKRTITTAAAICWVKGIKPEVNNE